MKRKLTIHDIAKELKVSAVTVSIIMNGWADEMRISKQQQERVKNHLIKTGFHPNVIAQSLRTGKTYTIGVLVEDISDPFFSSISKCLETFAYQLGYKNFFSSTENDTGKAKALVQVFWHRRVGGYLIAPAPGIEI